MKLLIASIATETNTFSPFPTGQSDFEKAGRIFHGKGQSYEKLSTSSEINSVPVSDFAGISTIVQQAGKHGWDSYLSLLTDASPAGPTVRTVYENFRQEILDDVRNNMPLDGVFLPLHGAMVAFNYDDCEGDLIKAIRNITGPDCIIGVSLDPHCHLTEKMVDYADIIMCLKEYPHIDGPKTMDRVLELMAQTRLRIVRPVMSLFDCRMIDGYYTDREPMTSFVNGMKEAEKHPVLAISLAMGFPWADTPDVGTKFLVITDNNKPAGDQLSRQFGKALFDIRGTTFPVGITIEEAINRVRSNTEGTLVMADWSDVSSGGAAGDSTIFLKQLIDAAIENIAFGILYDPLAVGIAINAGVGAQLNLRVGGKLSNSSGQPLDLDIEVMGFAENVFQNYNEFDENMGTLVHIRTGTIDLLLGAERVQPRSTDCFDKMGIDLTQMHLVVIKSMHHYRLFYKHLAKEMLDVVGGGLLNPDFANLPYRRIQRPKWPLDENPFETDPLAKTVELQ